MRALHRPELGKRLADYLRDQQKRLEAGADVERTWKAQRQTAAMKRIEEILRRMTGRRERCMYCEDSRATDFEHFWPKRQFLERCFQWENLLWACAACNRVKGNRFPRDSAGAPLLIDPTAVDPWDLLFYDPETDELAARWDPKTGHEYAKGVRTLEVLATLRHQALVEGRGRTRRNLQRAVRAFLGSQPSTESEAELLESISDNDAYGLTIWFFFREGQEDAPFSDLRHKHPELWEKIRIQIVGQA